MKDRAPHTDVLVVGAGVAGLSAALYLQRSGRSVLVVDRQAPASATSSGNAGLISPDTVVPIATPGMVREVPRWLMDRQGPLTVRWGRVPGAAPWLLRWIAASRPTRVLQISAAMRALHRDALHCWSELVGPETMARLVRTGGQVRVSRQPTALSALERSLFERHGIAVEPLAGAQLRELYPALQAGPWSGFRLPGNAHTLDPQRLVATLADRLREAGGRVLQERVSRIVPEGSAYRVETGQGTHAAPQLVVAAGIWSLPLLKPLGLRIPLESERGYHVMLDAPGFPLAAPLTVKDHGLVITALATGLRVAGTVEIAGVDAPPDEARAAALATQARQVFPDLPARSTATWLGHRPSTPDSLPVVGAVPGYPGLYLMLGHGHFGLTAAPPSGRLLARLMTGQAPGLDPSPYAPARFLGG